MLDQPEELLRAIRLGEDSRLELESVRFRGNTVVGVTSPFPTRLSVSQATIRSSSARRSVDHVLSFDGYLPALESVMAGASVWTTPTSHG